MRSSLLFLFIFLIAGLAKAQPTITSASEAIPGDVLVYPNTQLNGVAVPTTGANITWDYSGLVDSGRIEVDSFKTPSTTPYSSLFSGSNLALSTSGSYIYFKTSTSDWLALGVITPGVDTGYYLSGLEEFHLPFTYGSSFLDSTKTESFFTGSSDTTEMVVLQQGTGYGTLKLPHGETYSNVLQVKKQNTTRIKIGPITINSITNSFLFVTPGARSFLMEMDLSPQNDFSGIKYVYTGAIVIPTSYTFNGNGDWTNAANWSGNAVPTSPVPSGTTVTISPQAGGSCTLNTPITFSSGAILTVKTGAVFKVMGNLTIIK